MPERSARSNPLALTWAVSGQGMLFKAIVLGAERGLFPLRIAGVVTDRESPVQRFAAERGIAHIRIEPPEADRTRFNADMAEAFRRTRADWVGMTFNRLLGNEPIDAVGGRILNVHFALLPLFKGFGPVRQALSSGMRVAGVTVHLVNEGMDEGRIIGQTVVGIAPDDAQTSLGRRMFEAAVPMLLQVCRSVASGELQLDSEREPRWSRARSTHAGLGSFPSIDADLIEFGHWFCASLTEDSAPQSR